MSKEFEEIVLKKLDNLETGLKGNNQRLGNLEKEVKNNNQRLGNLEIEVKNNSQRLDNLETEVRNNSQRLDNLETGVKNANQRLGNLEIEVKDTGESILELRQRFTVFDFEINRKIDILFDSDTVNKENIVSLNVKNYNHNTRISNLENKDMHLLKV